MDILNVLELVSKTGDLDKVTAFIDRIMEARIKQNQQSLENLKLGGRSSSKKIEVTSQDHEFVRVYSNLLEDQDTPLSPFQNILLYSPEAITYIMDQQITRVNNEVQRKDKIFIDLSFFNSQKHGHESELSVINLLFSKGKYKIIEHPLLELMVQMKWGRIKSFFLFGFLFQLLYTMVVTGYAVFHFSGEWKSSKEHLQYPFYIALLVGSSLRILDTLLKTESFLKKLFKRKKINLLEHNSELFEMFLIFNYLLTPTLAFITIGNR